MLEWFKSHVFLAAWASPIIALVGLIWKKSDPTNPLNWSKVIFYVAFLTALAVVITPGVEATARGTMTGLLSLGFGLLMLDILWKR
jgi:hypothetical protein